MVAGESAGRSPGGETDGRFGRSEVAPKGEPELPAKAPKQEADVPVTAPKANGGPLAKKKEDKK